MHVMSHRDKLIALHASCCQSAPSRPGEVSTLVPMPLTTLSTGLSAAKLLAACLTAAARMRRVLKAASSLLHSGMLMTQSCLLCGQSCSNNFSIAGM